MADKLGRGKYDRTPILKKYTWDGEWLTVPQIARKLDRPQNTIHTWIRAGYTSQPPHRQRRQRAPKQYQWDGTLMTVYEIMTLTGATKNRVRHWLVKHKFTTTEQATALKPRVSHPVKWNGVLWQSKTQLCKHLRIGASVLNKYLKAGFTCDEDVANNKPQPKRFARNSEAKKWRALQAQIMAMKK